MCKYTNYRRICWISASAFRIWVKIVSLCHNARYVYNLCNCFPCNPGTTQRSNDGIICDQQLINDWSVILLCLPCIIFHEYMCGFLLFMEFWCFAMRFSGCYEIWLSHRQNNILVTKHLLAINDTTSE